MKYQSEFHREFYKNAKNSGYEVNEQMFSQHEQGLYIEWLEGKLEDNYGKLSMDIIQELNSLKRQHSQCEDPWYSCPKNPEGCANEGQGSQCNCGADKHNQTIDNVVDRLMPLFKKDKSWNGIKLQQVF